MGFVGASYWQEPPESRLEIAALTDSRCFLCRESLEGLPFVEWKLGPLWGPAQQQVIGMHLEHAYGLGIGILKDLAASWNLDPSELNQFLAAYNAQLKERGSDHDK